MATISTASPQNKICTAYPGPGLLSLPSGRPAVTFRPSNLSALGHAESRPFATPLTDSQGATARAAMGEPVSATGLASDGVATADHAARGVGSIARAARLARSARGVTGAARAGVAGAAALEQTTGLTRGLRVADGVLGPLGMLAGGVGVAAGLHQIREGKLVEGGLDVVGGGASVVSGGAATASAVMGAAAPAAAAALAAGGAGVAAAADGIKDIYQGVRDGNTEQAVTGGVKTVAGGLLVGGAATANPIAIGAGAVLYGGAVIYENRQAIADGARWVGNKVADGFSAVTNAVGDGLSSLGNAAGRLWDAVF